MEGILVGKINRSRSSSGYVLMLVVEVEEARGSSEGSWQAFRSEELHRSFPLHVRWPSVHLPLRMHATRRPKFYLWISHLYRRPFFFTISIPETIERGLSPLTVSSSVLFTCHIIFILS